MESKLRCLELFEQSIKSKVTLDFYKRTLDYFLKRAHKDYESLLLMPSDQLQVLLEDYVFYLKKHMHPNSVQNYLFGIFRFLDSNDREYKKKKLLMFLPEKVKLQGAKAYTTVQIQKLLEFADSKRAKALIHFLAASGCRIGVIEELKWKHVFEMPDNSYGITVYAGSNHEYTAFIHSEARKALDDYAEERRKSGEHINEDSFVFGPNKLSLRTKPMTGKAARSVINGILIT